MKLEIFTDGAARGNPGPAAIGVVIYDEEKQVIEEYKEYIGETTNNTAEYRALLAGLKAARKYAPCSLSFFLDSDLVVHQMNLQWRVKDPNLSMLFGQARTMMGDFESVEFKYVPREQNKLADKLCNQALDRAGK